MFPGKVIMPVRMRSPVNLKYHRFQSAILLQNTYRAVWREISHKYGRADNPANVCKDTPAIKLPGHTVFTVAHTHTASRV